jgi:hypothetical protein
MKTKILILSVSMILLTIIGCTKRKGCTSTWADNYDSQAETNDGSCYKYACTSPDATNYWVKATDDCCCKYDVQYLLSCSSCDITYENSSGGVSQQGNVGSSWSYSFTGNTGDFVYISAQNQNDYGSITVTIKRGNTVYKTSTSSGAYVIATASGSI